MVSKAQAERYFLLRRRKEWEEWHRKNRVDILRYPLVITKKEWDTILDMLPSHYPIHIGAFSIGGEYVFHPEWDYCRVYEVYIHYTNWLVPRQFGPYKKIGLAEEKVTKVLVEAGALILLDEEDAKELNWRKYP